MPSFVGQASAGAFQSPVTVNYSSTVGGMLVLFVHHHGSTTSPTITDSAGNSWQIAGATTSATGNEGRGTLYYCLNATPITSVSIPQQSSVVYAILAEFSGVASFRGANSAYQQFPSSRQVTTATLAGDLVIGHASVWAQNEQPPTPSAGWTALSPEGSDANWIAAAYDLESAGGSVGPTFTMPSGVGKFGNITAAFIPAVSFNSGTIAAELAAVNGVIVGDLTNPGMIDTVLPAVTGGASGSSANAGELTGSLPGIVGEIVGDSPGMLNGGLPKLTGAAVGQSTNPGTIAGTLPAIGVGGMATATTANPATLAGHLATVVAELDGATVNPATLTALLPQAVGAAATVTGPQNFTIIPGPVTCGWDAAVPLKGWSAAQPRGDQWVGEQPAKGWTPGSPVGGRWSADKPTAAPWSGDKPVRGWTPGPVTK